ncbi:TPA: DUF2574 family protein [Citrobacter freundii]|uniref:DUF2574 family protein n=1 Tax=Citrobacter freundii TaxID=546 RepID=UPI000299C25C|nr:DUF2574 family protein [Citrobacter freundii]EKS55814.1 hypothetical protein D186_16127 [Citrobacter freundii ATCC 8090 = MTCC 1658 = NBRC 12681]EKV0154230.1 DUF2574 family protein [Citrobacter freundii]EKX5046137.1 DUF2574 family protein [Citrobacter freundii]ELK7390118.1 DUF2574 family protein [Citrobacter freundii]EXF29379.1 membrane protein [Citrobacter freundii RLS1]
MKKILFLGVITLAYGMSTSVFATDTATLNINGRVTEPTCSADVVNNEVQQRCGNAVSFSNVKEGFSNLQKGAVTEIVTVPGDATRQILLTRYD